MNTSTGSLDGCTIQPFYYQQLVGSPFRSIQVDSRRIGALVLTGMVFFLVQDSPGTHSVDASDIRKQKNSDSYIWPHENTWEYAGWRDLLHSDKRK